MRVSNDKYRAQANLWGPAAQARYRDARVGVFGVGGTGAAHAHLLARAGVGYLRLVDRDVVEFGDLHRTQLYDEEDARTPTPKAAAAARRLAAVNGDVRLEPVVAMVRPDNVLALAADLDVLVDGADNFALRYLLNEVAVKTGTPLVYEGAVAARGAAMAVVPGVGPCLKCLLPEEPAPGAAPTCAQVGVSPAAVAAAAAAAAGLTLALLRGEGAAVAGRLFGFDDPARATTIMVARRPDCPCCAGRGFPHLEKPRPPEPEVAVVCGGCAFEIRPGAADYRFSLPDIETRLAGRYALERRGEILWVDAGEATFILFDDGRALVYGAADAERARALFDRLIGT